MNQVVITGANRGIGLALVEHYVAQGAKVFAACRQSSAELRETGADIIAGVDVTDERAVKMLAAYLDGTKIDVLINNAGILLGGGLEQLNFEDIIRQFEVNAVAPLRVVSMLSASLKEGSKVAMITSRMGSMGDNTSGGYYGYRMSKAALNAVGMSLAQDLKPMGVAVALLHPGFVQTDMVNYAGDISAEQAARQLVDRIDDLTIDNSGTFWHSNGEVLPW